MKIKQRRNKIGIVVFTFIGLLITVFSLYGQLSRRGYIAPLSYLLDMICWNSCTDYRISSRLHTQLPQQNLLNYNQPIKDIVTIEKIGKNKISILIEKSRHRLTIYAERRPIKSYPVVFGFNPVNDKLKEGDGSTPEGIFKIRDLYPHPSWSKFLWLDYPNQQSWRRNTKAKLEGKISWFDSIGSEVGIHGVPNGRDNLIDERSNWTLGCISLKNKDIDEIYQVMQKGTLVEIIQ